MIFAQILMIGLKKTNIIGQYPVPMCHQGVWSGHLPDFYPEHVHPHCCQAALWLRHVRPHPPGIGGGNYGHRVINAFKVFCCCSVFFFYVWSWISRWFKDVSWRGCCVLFLGVLCDVVSLTGCHVPSLPRDVGQMGTPSGTESTSNHIVLWWVEQCSSKRWTESQWTRSLWTCSVFVCLVILIWFSRCSLLPPLPKKKLNIHLTH